ncbi:MAG: hypothetical protein R2754_11265 [Microthrixaceae bacterium]
MGSEGTRSLPPDLLAGGADVRVGTDPHVEGAPRVRVLTIRSSHRCEVAVLHDDHIAHWVNASDLNATELSALLGLSSVVARSDAARAGAVALRLDRPEINSSTDGLVLVNRWRPGLCVEAPITWAPSEALDSQGFLPTGDWGSRSGGPNAETDEQVLASLEAGLGQPTRLPEPAGDRSSTLNSLIPPRVGDDLELTVVVTLAREAVSVSGAGLVHVTGPAHRPTTAVIGWSPIPATAANGDDGGIDWFVAAAEARAGEVTARLGTVGGFRMLETRRSGHHGVERLRLDNQPGWSASAVLNELCGLGADRLSIVSYHDIDDVALVTVENAQLMSRRIAHVLVPAGDPHPNDPDPGEALRHLMAGMRSVAPQIEATAAPLDAGLTQQLGDHLDALTGAQQLRVHVGLEVDDEWLTPHGRVRLRYQRFHVDTEADAAATGPRGETLWADRNRHLTEQPQRCRYCHSDVCDRCTDGIVACELCAEELCRSCASAHDAAGTSVDGEALALCEACTKLGPARRPQAMTWPPQASLSGHPLMGTDRYHRVVIAPSATGGAWRRVIQPSGTQTTEEIGLSPAMADYLSGKGGPSPNPAFTARARREPHAEVSAAATANNNNGSMLNR